MIGWLVISVTVVGELLILFSLLVTGQVLGPFALTHEEIVERRRLLLGREQNVSVQGEIFLP